MDNKLQIAVNILQKNNQEHLLNFYDELDESQKAYLINQILSIDFAQLNNLFENSKKDDSIEESRISPVSYFSKDNLPKDKVSLYYDIGEQYIKNGELAVLTLAGGKGSRLGYKGPKGSYEIDVPPKKSLFEFICDNLKNSFTLYNVYLPWYIMTSPSNDLSTRKFFEEKDYFNYPKEKVFFFCQDTLPIIDLYGKIILDNTYSIAQASNGNGDVFRAFSDSNMLESIKAQHISWISVCGVDNIILDIIDPIFLGLSIENKSSVASKSVKSSNIVNDWVFANVDGLPSIIDSRNLSESTLNSKNQFGQYNYNQVNILAHLFSVKAFDLLKDINLPYHRAFKKNVFVNEEGMKVVPSHPNSFKFEKFIFDSFRYFKNFTLLEVNASKEFAPIKSFTGDSTPETALKLYLQKFNL